MKKGPCTYIVQCKDDSLYTGWTNDIEERIETHNKGLGAKYTRGRGPVKLVYLEYFEEKVEAMKREAAIKKLKPQLKRELISSKQNQL